MYNWNFSPDHSISLPLASDARFSRTDYINDQIWEFKFGSSDPPAISIETNFGLRARLCRIFPRFTYDGQVVSDPKQFSHPITIHRYFPNYIELTFKPFSFINARLECWVPESQVIVGRINLTNTSHEARTMQLEWAELLLPSPDGSRMSIKEIELTTLLAGKTSNLSPVLFLTGGAQAGKSPYPSLHLSIDIPSHGEREYRWAHASLPEMNASYELAKAVINKNWQAEVAHITRVNSRQMEIYTGDKDWDTAFYLSQNIAQQLFLNPTQNFIAPSIVTTRKPDQGFSLLGDGSDYNHLWNGQTPVDTLYLANFLLPASPDLLKGLVDNFLEVQTPQGEIDWKPGLGGQRSHLLATPLLAHISLQIYEYTGDREYLKSIFPKLLSFFLSWFQSSHDRDGDLIPEWDQAIQTGFEDLPLFSLHHPWSLGVDISTVESPDLCSYLYKECLSLISIGERIQEHESARQLETYAEKLKSMVEQTWSDHHACYLYRDRDTHFSTPQEFLGSRQGAGILEIYRDFNQPIRPVVELESGKDVTHPTQIFIHGSGTTGAHKVENITAGGIHWQQQKGFATSEYAFNSIEHIEINGIRPDDTVIVHTVDYSNLDQSLLLPLWAGIPSEERAKILINLTILNRKKFLSPNGLRSCIDFPGMSNAPEEYSGSHLPWTAQILDGLLKYGKRDKAAEVFIRLMKPVSHSLHSSMTFHQSYNQDTGKSLGAQNSLTSLIPPGLFLRILGIKIISPFKFENSGHNPFPWPVTVKYQGLTVVKQEKRTLAIFPDGQTITVDNDQLRVISSEIQAQRSGTSG